MQDLIRPSKIQDPELRDIIGAINSLFTKLLILIRKYMKYNLEDKHIFDLKFDYIEDCTYSLGLRVCDNQFMTNYVDEIFKLTTPRIKQKCHFSDMCGEGWYLINVKVTVSRDIAYKIYCHKMMYKYILNNIISVTSMSDIIALDFWLPYTWQKILNEVSIDDDDLGNDYDFSWRRISLSGKYTTAPSAIKSLIDRSRKAFHLLSSYVKVFEEYMTTIYPKDVYKIDYEATRL